MRNYFTIILVLLVCSIYSMSLPNKVIGQTVDYNNTPEKSYKIAILPIKLPIQEIFNTGINYVGSRLTQSIRLIPGIEALNVISSLRALNNSKANRNFKTLEKDMNNSELPDPYDLYEIANALDANKIIIIAGSFDTQRDILKRSTFSIVNPLALYSIKPMLDFNTVIYLFDPTTGNLEWTKTYQGKFLVRDFHITTSQLAENPIYTEDFDKFTVKLSQDVNLNLQKLFYGAQNSSVTAKIVPQPSLLIKATEGDTTTDGHPFTANPIQGPQTNQFIGPITNNETLNTNNKSLTTPYSAEITQPTTETDETNKTNNDNSLIKEYQNNILKKY